MIEKLISIKGLGLLEAVTTPTDFGQVTLIYGENGKGKSTFASLLRSAASGIATELESKTTLGFQGQPEAHILVGTPGGRITSSLKDGTWQNTVPNIEVFDSNFVDENVYSGMAVDAKQRQRLLDFVLGREPVEIKKSIELLDSESRKVSTERTNAETALRGYANPFSVSDYIKAVVPADLERQLQDALQRLQDIKNNESIKARAKPTSVKQLEFHLDELFEAFDITIEGLEREAELRMRNHIGQKPPEMEAWLQQGLSYCGDSSCPFCGQSQGPESLITSYQKFFNQAYVDFKKNLAALADKVKGRLSEGTVEKLSELSVQNNEYIKGWSPQIVLDQISFPEETFREALTSLRLHVEELLVTKLNSPLDVIHQTDREKARDLANAVNATLDTFRSDIQDRRSKIETYLLTLKPGDLKQAEMAVSRLQALKKRNLPEVADFVTKYSSAIKLYKELNTEKTGLQSKLRALSPQIIGPYMALINQLLRAFGAEFEISKAEQSNDGGRPAVKYCLKVKGHEIQLGNKESDKSTPSFGSTLSEGDKRTLALSFFLAKLKSDPKLSETIVVIDDPMSSLDRNRQRQTLQLVGQFARDARQLIVLSHDPRFLEALRVRVFPKQEAGTNPRLVTLELSRGSAGVTFSACNLSRRSLQGYSDKRARLQDFLDGQNTDAMAAVPLVRGVLEGFLKMKYPQVINADHSLGDIIYKVNEYPDFVKKSMTPHLERLKNLNETKVFSHGGNLDEELGLTDAEVRQLGLEVLNLIHSGL